MVDKRKLGLLVACGSLAGASWLSQILNLLPETQSTLLGLVAAVLGFIFIGHSALRSLMKGIFGIDVLAAVAILASMVVGEYVAAAVVVLMLGGGELLEGFAQERASSAITSLIEAFPQTAFVIRNGKEVEVPVQEINKGETVVVKPGGTIPVDGTILEGNATVNQASVTGEPLPVEKIRGSQVYSGTLVELGSLQIHTEAVGEESTYGRIIRMVQEAEGNQPPIVKLTDKFAKYYIPVIMLLGLGVYIQTGDLLIMASVFIIACPCALTLATPTAVAASIGNSAKKGILIRSGASLEKLDSIDTVVLDKTGTITTGEPIVTDIQPINEYTVEAIIALAAGAERHSEHPLAKAVINKANQLGVDPETGSDFKVYPGLGIQVETEKGTIVVGNEKLLLEKRVQLPEINTSGEARSTIYVVKNHEVIGLLRVSDTIRASARQALKDMRLNGIKKIVMLTGDHPETAKMIGEQVGIDTVIGGLLPSQKVDHINELKKNGNCVLMVGDGINDAPALATADVGVAMGLTGTDVAIETAGITLTTDDLSKLPKLLKIGKFTMSVIRLNIGFALLVNLVGIILSLFGIVTPLAASMIHEGNALLVMANSLRLLNVE